MRYLGSVSHLASNHFATISDSLHHSNKAIQWDICLNQAAQNWEIDDASSLFSFLYSFKFDGFVVDRML